VILTGLAVSQGACGSDREPPPGPDAQAAMHIHGLAYDRGSDAVLAATHMGLFEVTESSFERIGENAQDTMAFTVVGPGLYLASGHPGGYAQRDLPAFLGLIESRDGGETWSDLSLQGQVDFHLLGVDGRRVYGYGSDWATRKDSLYASDDGGLTWAKHRTPEPLLSLALDPVDSTTLVASGLRRLYISSNGGEKWTPLDQAPGLLAWQGPGSLYKAGPTGEVAVAASPTASFEVVGDIGEPPVAFTAAGRAMYAAGEDGSVIASENGGATWAGVVDP
jgi:photosystem II stability/assembly factor-like uncharacterized protein